LNISRHSQTEYQHHNTKHSMTLSTKFAVLKNFKFVVLDDSKKQFHLLRSEEEVQRYVEDGKLGDGDTVIELKADTMRLANLKTFIELA